MSKIKLDKIEDAIKSINNGEIIIVVDDENRENEGDFITAAETINSDKINFMAKHGRGLICVPMSENLCTKLNLEKMVPNNTDPLETAFTVSVDLKGNGVTSGISASDRSKTVQALVDSNTKPDDLQRPGHVFPLIAKDGGVLRRTGHTEAAIDFARLAGFKSAGVIVEIMNDDGSMSRLPELYKVAKKFNLKIVSIEDLVAYRMKNDSLIDKIFDENIRTSFGEYRLRAFKQTNNDQVHIALTLGDWKSSETILTRINSYEMAYQMQSSAPELMDLSSESEKTIELYGAKKGEASFANNCILARRLIERGTRFVQLYHTNWDSHGGPGETLDQDFEKVCKDVDQASAGLIIDLKQRGLLEDTLVIWGGEFGRTPMGETRKTTGRDHHIDAFTMWMAGAGLKKGYIHGKTDELGFGITEGKVHVHDLHATILHLLGFDHEQLTYRFQGREFRLTDVHGKIVNEILA